MQTHFSSWSGSDNYAIAKDGPQLWSSSQLIYKRVRDEERIQAWGIGTRKKGMKILHVPEYPRIYDRICREGLS